MDKSSNGRHRMSGNRAGNIYVVISGILFLYLFRGHILVLHRSYDNLFTAESPRAQSEFSFSFAAETPANENHHAFGKLGAF
jgi:hypothetical protein